jgi:hypothetical protein
VPHDKIVNRCRPDDKFSGRGIIFMPKHACGRGVLGDSNDRLAAAIGSGYVEQANIFQVVNLNISPKQINIPLKRFKRYDGASGANSLCQR